MGLTYKTSYLPFKSTWDGSKAHIIQPYLYSCIWALGRLHVFRANDLISCISWIVNLWAYGHKYTNITALIILLGYWGVEVVLSISVHTFRSGVPSTAWWHSVPSTCVLSLTRYLLKALVSGSTRWLHIILLGIWTYNIKLFVLAITFAFVRFVFWV